MMGAEELEEPGPSPLVAAVVGAGHVGLVTATCLAALGHRVRVLEALEDRVAMLRTGRTPFVEPGMDALLSRGLARGNLSVHSAPESSIPGADVVFVCVDTPNLPDGTVDLQAVERAAWTAVRHASKGSVLVNRSTSPVGTGSHLRRMADEARHGEIGVAVNPEFLSEGTAVRDFLCPDRLVFGAWDPQPIVLLLRAYSRVIDRAVPEELVPGNPVPPPSPLRRVPVVIADPFTAELSKYAANAFLAVKISFINEVASIAEEVGADVTQVAEAIGLDRRIGPHFLRAGLGWGGSCFPKDIVALRGMAETRGLAARMLAAAHEVNHDQQRWAVRRLQRHLKTLVGRRIGLLGVSFKPDTDDLRNAPALDIAAELSRHGARVRAFDPAVRALPPDLAGIMALAADPMDLADGADALVLVTEWPEFASLDLVALGTVMRTPLLLDGRNMVDPATARAAGFAYVGVGRSDDAVVPEPSSALSLA